jgi:hypothetical protein
MRKGDAAHGPNRTSLKNLTRGTGSSRNAKYVLGGVVSSSRAHAAELLNGFLGALDDLTQLN